MLATSTHVFSQICLHLNWHCKADRPMITPEIEPVLHGFIENYCRKCKGIRFHAVGGTADHLHLAFQAEPHIQISEWIGKIKGASSHEMNDRFAQSALQWQRGYGIVSFAMKDLPAVMKYVAEQKERHGKGKLNAVLERFGESIGHEEN